MLNFLQKRYLTEWDRIIIPTRPYESAAASPMDEATCIDYLVAQCPDVLVAETLAALQTTDEVKSGQADEQAMADALVAARHAFIDEPREVMRSLACEALDCLRAFDPAALSALLSRLAPAPAPDLRKVLVRRARRLGRKKTLLAGLAGYASSYAAVLEDEELTWVGGKRPPTALATSPNLFATMLTIFRDIRAYHEKKHQTHTEVVWLKRLSAGFRTAMELAERRQAAGLDVGDDAALFDAFVYGYSYDPSLAEED
jgi:hypothetical protein